jgi:hypothetical protein
MGGREGIPTSSSSHSHSRYLKKKKVSFFNSGENDSVCVEDGKALSERAAEQ